MSVDVLAAPEDISPKFQFINVMVLPKGAIDKSVKDTALFLQPIVVVKLAMGACPETVTLIVSLAMQLFVLVTTTEYCPVVLISKELLLEPLLQV